MTTLPIPAIAPLWVKKRDPGRTRIMCCASTEKMPGKQKELIIHMSKTVPIRAEERNCPEVARLIGMAASAISYAVMRGKKIAEEKGLHAIEELLK